MNPSLDFNPHVWLDKYHKASDPLYQKTLRVEIIDGTIEVFEKYKEYYYLTPEGAFRVPLGDQLSKQIQYERNFYYPTTEFISPKSFPDKYETRIYLQNSDSIDTAIKLRNHNYNPLILNMANATHPGGGYRHGAAAQEESLFRRSNYFQFLDPNFCDPRDMGLYPINEFGAIHSSNVLVIRQNESLGYAFLPEPIPLHFVAVAAYPNPPLTNGHLNSDFASKTKRKIRAMFNVALNHKHDALVLGAFGCGAFKNPAYDIAQLFKEVILEYWNKLRLVVFAILEDQNTFKSHNPNGNYLPFQKCFADLLSFS
eukprot:TRINITY_DN3493_c0_g1_i1.p1 TRINITY_DN3493_c0_g1~~TRINITY_DN3493_c0_g1_i1.p1  ORF type:complete len:312 (-),score=39.71 TRINITY_DN3493_c0_g1_i1:101-1036(-)